MITEKRLYELTDMLCTHLAMNRHKKALLIAQALRRSCKEVVIMKLNIWSGHRVQEDSVCPDCGSSEWDGCYCGIGKTAGGR